jgi:hypothetical protein
VTIDLTTQQSAEPCCCSKRYLEAVDITAAVDEAIAIPDDETAFATDTAVAVEVVVSPVIEAVAEAGPFEAHSRSAPRRGKAVC